MRHFIDDVSQLQAPLGVFLERAKGLYDENLSTYVRLVLRRSFSRLMVSRYVDVADHQDFFDGVERTLQTSPADEIPVHASFSRSALKKVLKDIGAKDMRKAVDAMAKRVDKHFADEEEDAASTALVQTVWREVTNELKREAGRAQELIGKVYPDAGGIEFGANEVEAACRGKVR